MAWFYRGRKYWYHNGKRYSCLVRNNKSSYKYNSGLFDFDIPILKPDTGTNPKGKVVYWGDEAIGFSKNGELNIDNPRYKNDKFIHSVYREKYHKQKNNGYIQL